MAVWRSSSSMHDFHLEPIKLSVNLNGQLRSMGILRSYMLFDVSIVCKYR